MNRETFEDHNVQGDLEMGVRQDLCQALTYGVCWCSTARFNSRPMVSTWSSWLSGTTCALW